MTANEVYIEQLEEKIKDLEKECDQYLEITGIEASGYDEARASLAALVQAAQAIGQFKRLHPYGWVVPEEHLNRLATVLADLPAAAQALLEELEQERSINATSVKAAGNYTKQIDVLQAQLREAEGVNAQLRHALKSLPERDATAKLEAVRKVADDLRLMDNEYNRKHHQTAIDSALEVADDIDAALAEPAEEATDES